MNVRPRDREVEVNEAQVTMAVILALLAGAGIFYLGLWVGGWLAQGDATSSGSTVSTRPSQAALPAVAGDAMPTVVVNNIAATASWGNRLFMYTSEI